MHKLSESTIIINGKWLTNKTLFICNPNTCQEIIDGLQVQQYLFIACGFTI